MESAEQAQMRLRVYLLRHHADVLDAAERRGASVVDVALDLLERGRTAPPSAPAPLTPLPRPRVLPPRAPAPAAKTLGERLHTEEKPRRTASPAVWAPRPDRPGAISKA